MNLLDPLLGPLAAGIIVVIAQILAFIHVILTKRDVRGAIGWSGLIWLVPFIGSLIYILFGVNRIRRKARREGLQRTGFGLDTESRARVDAAFADAAPALKAHARLVDGLNDMPLIAGNEIRFMDEGRAAFPAMIDAINGATRSIALTTYIFDNDHWGKRFVAALRKAQQRGVQVRILVDGVGNLYSTPPISQVFEKHDIPVALFNARLLPWRTIYLNLRNHRKIMIVDGHIGFTGGMNIRAGNIARGRALPEIRDLHFEVAGPLVAQMMQVFVDDWAFASGELLAPDFWMPPVAALPGGAIVRGIADGPDSEDDVIRSVFVSALNMATDRVIIISPYFIPGPVLMAALNQAAMRGVKVDIVLPEVSNLRIVHWAARSQFSRLIEKGCRIHLSPPPFDHSKLMVVDGGWALFGSSNWDPRSLRLNFEFNVEVYDKTVAGDLEAIARARLAAARTLTLGEMQDRPLGARVRDGLAWLASPYL